VIGRSEQKVDPTYGFSKGEIDVILSDQHLRIDRIMERFLMVHCAIAFALAFFYSTWMVTVPVAVFAYLMFAVSRRMMPGSFGTRCVAGISLLTFCSLHIYQMHGMPEMHFFFFTAETMMILYYDAEAFWPGTLLIIIQNILFAGLTNAGYHLQFFPESHITVAKQFFHYSIAVGQVGVCAWLAYYLRQALLRDTQQRFSLMQTNSALMEARTAADKANQIKSQFLANMSHELRTPLNGVIGMCGLLEETETSQRSRDYVECIKSSGETLTSLINDILDLSKIEAGKISIRPQAVNLEVLIDEILATTQSRAVERGLEFFAIVDSNLPREIQADPDRVKQIWINLIGNALKFTESGSVVLRIGWNQIDGKQGSLISSVTDTGIGIADDSLDSIFECFSQVGDKVSHDNGGTGLGLAISRQLAVAMGGSLAVESELGAGSTFTFRLPAIGIARQELAQPKSKDCLILDHSALAAESLASILVLCGHPATVVKDDNFQHALNQQWHVVFASDLWLQRNGQEAIHRFSYERVIVTTRDSADSAGHVIYLRTPFRFSQVRTTLVGERCVSHDLSTKGSLSGRRFLIVEDNRINQRILLEILKRQGAEVDLAENGKIGLDAMKSTVYDLVFMDCQMPVMGGIECTRLIRQFEAGSGVHRKIVATTANAMSGDQDECLRSGMDGYLSKPITRTALFAAIEQMLGDERSQVAA
jgi:signal transduction histidine kinase/CheY-like chemotaxis protein